MKRVLLILPLFSILLFGHPRMFVDILLDIENQKKEIKKVKIKWVFDEMNSAMLIMDYDKDFNKKFSKSEIADFKKNVFDTLGEFSYYTHLKVDKKRIKIKNLISDFSLELKKRRFIVKYSLDLTKLKAKNSFELGFWDEEFYTSMVLVSKNIKFKQKIDFDVVDVQHDIYLGYVMRVKQ